MFRFARWLGCQLAACHGGRERRAPERKEAVHQRYLPELRRATRNDCRQAYSSRIGHHSADELVRTCQRAPARKKSPVRLGCTGLLPGSGY